MKLGLFIMPNHPPERSLYDATQWDIEMIKDADALGFEEAWIGEHFTMEWEPIPAPDLIIAQALRETKRIKLAPGAHLLPYHHPAELAHRVAYLDHLAQGRLMFGIGAGGVPTDYTLFNVDAQSGQHRKMAAEALEIILKLWKEEGPWEYKGQYWSVNKPGIEYNGLLGSHLTPYQKPYPPIGIAGLSRNSETLKMAGEYGFIPMSFGYSHGVVASHWDSIVEGANRSGKTPNRENWRVSQDVFVADTDEEAYE
ncbi:LLM class flavin-dependent oxidoreductase, partial [Bacillus sp. JJ1773]|uniref:LLM class flavin-dependent oxidoreductase n=1 Tax=Bacillus sp. JJ1773 TaxID=3122965 RepID=UPI002FFF3DE4